MMEETEFGPSLNFKVWAKNFRSIEYAELELGPLTVLVWTQQLLGRAICLDLSMCFLGDTAREGLETAISRRGGIEFHLGAGLRVEEPLWSWET